MTPSRALYGVLGGIATAAWMPWGAIQHARGHTDLGQRLALRAPRDTQTRPVWLHAASLGEVNAAAPLAQVLGAPLVWTAQTPAGVARARAVSPEAVVLLAPFDACGAPARFLRHVQPRALLVAETEVWPGWLYAAAAAHVPVAFINARMSARSARRYRRFARWVRESFGKVALVAAQSDADAARFRACGVSDGALVVTGNMKWDQPAVDVTASALTAWLRGTGRPVCVAGSTRPGEERAVAVAMQGVRVAAASALLVVAPRHLARLHEAEDALRAAWPGIRVARWTQLHAAPQHGAPLDVLLLDTLGDLPAAFAAATVAFVGGTLTAYGGHNVAEPALSGVPVAFGPSTSQCADAAQLLLEAGGARRVSDATQLTTAWTAWLLDEEARAAAGRAARVAVECARGATARTLDALTRRGIVARGAGA